LDDEVRFHLELETGRLVTHGLPRAEAKRRARLAFGSVEGIKEDSRGVRGISVVDIVRQVVQYALRGIRRRPAFSAAVILTLGTRGLLVIVQGALSVVLLVGAGLFVRSLRNVQSMRLGFDIDPVVLVARNMRSVSMSDTAQAALSERMLEAATVFPGVEAASRARTVPMQQTWSVGVDVEGPLLRKVSAQRNEEQCRRA